MKVSFIYPQLQDYLFSLQKPTISKIVRLVDLLEKYGKHLGMPYAKKLSGNLYELRVGGQQEVRIFYCFFEHQIILVHAFIKKSQKTPQKELKTALSRIKSLTKL